MSAHFLMTVAFLGHVQLPQRSLGLALETEVQVLGPLMNPKTQAGPESLTPSTCPGDTGVAEGPRLPEVWWGPWTVGFR